MNREFQTLSPQTRQELCEVMDIMETELTVEEIREQLEMTQKGAVKNNRHNCKLILEHDPLLKDVFRHNILTEQTDIVKPVWWERISPAFTDMDLNYIMLYLEETYGLTMDKIVQKISPCPGLFEQSAMGWAGTYPLCAASFSWCTCG